MITHTEENYLKAIFKIAEKEKKSVSTNAISGEMRTTAASVTDMLKRLAEKELIQYKRYKGVQLTKEGNRVATQLVRKHRLWEVFLVDKLDFGWDQVHEIAEQLEHIDSVELINRLENFLGQPKFDPHGDPIPNREGKFTLRNQIVLTEAPLNEYCEIVGVREHSNIFLRHLNELGIQLQKKIILEERFDYDNSVRIRLDQQSILVSGKVAENIFVKRINVSN
jgi:DtxR family Mn-dependent transcriptional regulator